MRVHFVGEADDGISVSSHHARALSAAGVETSFDSPDPAQMRPLRQADVIHVVTHEQTDAGLVRRLAAARLVGVPIVRFWTGRDLLWAKHHPASRAVAHALTRLGTVQLARTQTLADELARLGIPAAVGPVLGPHISSALDPRPLPEPFTALCSLPTERREFCGGKWIDVLIRRLPGVRFLILADEGTDYRAVKNVESLGTVPDVTRTIERSAVVLQPRMDGMLSRLSLEALCRGRHVIATHPLPHCEYAGSLEAFTLAIRKLERSTDFNLAGREYVCREYSQPEMVRRMLEILSPSSDEDGPLGGGWGRAWRGALAALCQPGLWSSAKFARPDLDSLPPEASAFRALLSSRTSVECQEPVAEGEADR